MLKTSAPKPQRLAQLVSLAFITSVGGAAFADTVDLGTVGASGAAGSTVSVKAERGTAASVAPTQASLSATQSTGIRDPGGSAGGASGAAASGNADPTTQCDSRLATGTVTQLMLARSMKERVLPLPSKSPCERRLGCNRPITSAAMRTTLRYRYSSKSIQT